MTDLKCLTTALEFEYFDFRRFLLPSIATRSPTRGLTIHNPWGVKSARTAFQPVCSTNRCAKRCVISPATSARGMSFVMGH